MEKPLSINSKSRIDQSGGKLMNQHIVQLIRERFYPLVLFCGPQSTGEVEIEGVRATVYLGELSIWLWPAKSSHNGVLSDEQLGDVVSPHLLVRNLLSSAQASMQCLSCHLDRIEAADGETVSLLRYYLEDCAATVVDGMALGRILGPRAGERAQ
jgi:hypothetical protein